MRLWRFTAVAGTLAVLLLQGLAIVRQSLTSDEIFHAIAGDQADRYGQNGLNLEHPPLVKMVAALSLASLPRPVAPLAQATSAKPICDAPGTEARVRLGGRSLGAAAFGMPLLIVAFLLGRELGGPAAGISLALLLGLNFCVFPYLSLIYTDTAAALGFGIVLLAAAASLRRPGLRSAILLGVGLGLALASKFTGLLAAPAVAGALLLAPLRSRGWPEIRRRLLHGAAVAVVAWGLVEVSYAVANRHYQAAYGLDTIRLYCGNHASMIVGDRLRPFEQRLLSLAGRDPRAAQWLTGLLATMAQNAIATYPACNFGRMHSHGYWWYYPVLLLARTPLVLLLAGAAALAAALLARRRRRAGSHAVAAGDREGFAGADPAAAARRRAFVALLAVTAAVYLLVAMTSNYNAGLRHLLPILPILYLPLALWTARRPRLALGLFALLLAESLALSPTWMSETNSWWLGGRDPMRFALSTDNCYYHQNLIALREVAERRALRPFFVLDPAIGAPQLDRYLGPGVGLPPEQTPLPAGWYAVGAAAEVCVPAILRSSAREMYGYPRYRSIADRWTPPVAAVQQAGEDLGYAASTFHLYRLARLAAPAAGGG
ncbi:MAG: glycosyltransferase family 39 protein [Acidobacteria bacterium]|nr:glycosyltransferase family 39 protein [Acidobacteriota bacterium]